MYERILVPLDGSPTAAKALEQAEALAEKLGSSLVLVRIVHTLGELAETATPSLSSQVAISQDVVARSGSDREHADARAYVENLRNALQKRGIKAEMHIGEGTPAEEIIKAARAAKADLIAMTGYGAGGAHTRSERAVFGGVADEVLRSAHLPVLLVRP